MQKFSLINLKETIDIDSISNINTNGQNCDGNIEISSNSSIISQETYETIKLNFILKKNNKYNTVGIIDSPLSEHIKMGYTVVKVKGEIMLLPIYNKSFERYLNKNLNKNLLFFSGLTFYENGNYTYILDQEIGSIDTGLIYEYDSLTNITTISYNNEYDQLTLNQQILLNISLNLKFTNKKQLYIDRGEKIDFNEFFYKLITNYNTNQLWDQ